MLGALVLVDTSIWIEVLRGTASPALEGCVDGLVTARRACTCEVIVAELVAGASDEVQLQELCAGLRGTEMLGMRGAGYTAGTLSLQLRRRGATVHTTDLLIAATAHLHGAALLHRDRHLAEAAEALGLEVLEP
jgi:predicted nucleic acid-binding protein